MYKSRIKFISLLLAVTLIVSLAACQNTENVNLKKTYGDNVTILNLSNQGSTIDEVPIEEFDYTWHCDPSSTHDEVKNAPAEYYTGTKPETESAVYIDHELFYFPKLNEDQFKLINYDGEQEWAYYYNDSENNEYIFATLPNESNSVPTYMMHTEEEAKENKVLHITKAGTYVLEGTFNGQIYIDLGDKDETFTDENAKVNLILHNADINCSVAPAIIGYSLFECDNKWEDSSTHDQNVSTENAGFTITVADDTENTVSGTNVYRMLKTKYKDDDSNNEIKLQKKLRKTDGALYSYVSANLNGESDNTGKLTINSKFEGLDTELHLSINGANTTINSDNDGINVNEDNVSVVTFNGGNTTITAGQGAEGDGVDSNGYIVINDGTLSINGIKPPDSALDSELGVFYNGGTVIIDNKEQDYKAGDTFKESGNMKNEGEMGKPMDPPDNQNDFNNMINNENFDIKDFKEKIASLDDDATLDDVLKILGMDKAPQMEMARENPGQMGDTPPEKPNQ